MTALGGTVAALVPVITAASTQTIGVGQDTTISGISLAETGNPTGETFTVVLSDTNGVLSATTVGCDNSRVNGARCRRNRCSTSG